MIKKICSILSTVLMVLMVLVAAALLVPYLFGYRPMAVLSASMEPAYPTGSVVFVKKVEPAEIEIGDPITFHREGLAEPITHRVIAIDTDARIFTTKGDNVSGVTDTVPFDSLIGRSSQFAIPLIGYVAVNIRTLPGILIACAVLLVVVLLAFLPDLFTKPSSGTPPEASPLPADALTEEKTDSGESEKIQSTHTQP